MKEFIESFRAVYKKPYPKAIDPKLGLKGVMADTFEAVQIDVVAKGKGELRNKPVEYVDIRVYMSEGGK